jgi:hypothetical protein
LSGRRTCTFSCTDFGQSSRAAVADIQYAEIINGQARYFKGDDTAEILGVPAGLITRVDGREIEILLSSETEGNPYPAAYKSQYPDSGWYCEHTLKSRGLNLIPNAL